MKHTAVIEQKIKRLQQRGQDLVKEKLVTEQNLNVIKGEIDNNNGRIQAYLEIKAEVEAQEGAKEKAQEAAADPATEEESPS